MIGERFGKLVIIKKSPRDWYCQCDCGNKKVVRYTYLKNGSMTSCGCNKGQPGISRPRDISKPRDYVGKRFGMLTCLEPKYIDGKHNWYCKCDCGLYTILRVDSLDTGTKSCGCLCKQKPRLSPEELKDRATRDTLKPLIAKWGKDVKSRDKYTCQKCNSKNNLEAHHIVSWSHNKEFRYDINNGITICEHCHKRFHFAYGYWGFDKNDLERFMKNV